MTGYDINVSRDLLPELLGNQDGLAKLVESVLNQILEAQVSESLGADRHERSEERQDYRNGYRVRTLYTRVGPVTLQVPQTRDGSFSTDIFKRYQRSKWLCGRGLKGVMFVMSDGHGGLVEAAAKHFQGARWQRCQVHLMRNLLGHSSTKVRADVAASAKLVFQAPDMVEARRRKEFMETFAKSAPKAVACMEAGFEDAMAVMVLPEKYRRRLRTTNMQGRLIEEVCRRERVIRIFPNDASALRLIGALLAEKNEDW